MIRLPLSCALALALTACASAPQPSSEPVVAQVPLAGGGARVQGVPRGAPLPGDNLDERAVSGLAIVGARLGLSSHTLDTYHLARIQKMGSGGIAIWRATVDGLPVIDGDLKIVIDAEGRLTGWSRGAGVGLQLLKGAPVLGAADAVQSVTGAAPGASVPRGEWSVFPDGSHARPVALSVDGALRRAWEVEYQDADGLWRVEVDAITGGELHRGALSANHSFRVYADPATLRPDDSAFEDVTPYPAAAPIGTVPVIGSSNLITTNGFIGDPWLDPSAVNLQGNNAIAYADRYDPDGFSAGDVSSEVSSPGMFDWSYDFDLYGAATEEQAQPGMTEAFYVVNWLHDWYYQSGFDELAGNAQTSNYGRGGLEGDAMKLELQDRVDFDRNNANMYVEGDGFAPRMQFYLWDEPPTLLVDGSPVESFVGWAFYGPQQFDLTGDLAVSLTDPYGCTVVDGDVAGKVVLVDRGFCLHQDKVENAQAAGAIGMILANSGDFPYLSTAADPTGLDIPVVVVSYTEGLALRGALDLGLVEVTLQRTAFDGALDNQVLAHEWGHYLFFRSVLGCGTNECYGVSEGNSDFVALLMSLRDGDDLDAAYGFGTYATHALGVFWPDPAWFGIRRVTYSRDPAKNALSFRHIADGEPLPTTAPLVDNGYPNSESHNAGEIWASAMFDAYLDLQEDGAARGLTFDQVERTMTDILVSGLALAPAAPTFLQTRDALLLAANGIDPQDAVVMANAFAARGMGSCATGPTAPDNTGVVESFDVTPRLTIGTPVVSLDPADECDADENLDAGERATISVVVTNESVLPLVGATVDLALDPVPGFAVVGGPSAAVPDLGAFESATVSFVATLDASAALTAAVGITATVSGGGSCNAPSSTTEVTLEADVGTQSSTTDTFAVQDGSWTAPPNAYTGSYAVPAAWSVKRDADTGDAAWNGPGTNGATDVRLESPTLQVTGDLVITLTHRYHFEYGYGIAWDGGVLELSVDGGPYTDVSDWVDPGYLAPLYDASFNPLANRMAFSDTNPSWPDYDVLVLDFGSALAGHDVRFSPRVGTDAAFGWEGWDITTVSVSGIGNLPFPSIQADVAAPTPTYLDADSDGFGGSAVSLSVCYPQPGFVGAATDCDDGNAGVSPSATEICNGADDDCDGLADDADPSVTGQGTTYVDLDGDGFGDPAVPIVACAPPVGTVADASDCDDARADVSPDAVEICDAVDDDCDGTVDQGAADAATWYADADGDGYTDPAEQVAGCDAPEGYAAASDEPDCDDGEADVFPGGTEIPGDGIDQDCSGADEPQEVEGDDCGCDSAAPAPGLALGWLTGALLFLRRRR